MLCVCVCLGVAYMELLVVRSVQAGAHWNGGYSKGMVGGLVKEHITNEHIKFLTHFWFDSMLMLMFEQSFWGLLLYCGIFCFGCGWGCRTFCFEALAKLAHCSTHTLSSDCDEWYWLLTICIDPGVNSLIFFFLRDHKSQLHPLTGLECTKFCKLDKHWSCRCLGFFCE